MHFGRTTDALWMYYGDTTDSLTCAMDALGVSHRCTSDAHWIHICAPGMHHISPCALRMHHECYLDVTRMYNDCSTEAWGIPHRCITNASQIWIHHGCTMDTVRMHCLRWSWVIVLGQSCLFIYLVVCFVNLFFQNATLPTIMNRSFRYFVGVIH